ncbi:MAG: hypothetical protein AB7K67_00765 [Hyphomicrobiaceae bacterium]|jgi:hypothetical protein
MAAKTPDPPDDMANGLYTVLEADGRVKFVLARDRRPAGYVTLPPGRASELAVRALGGAYHAFEQVNAGTVPNVDTPQPTTPYVRITGLGVGECPIEGFTCMIVMVGAAQFGLAMPKARLKEFAQWVTAQADALADDKPAPPPGA